MRRFVFWTGVYNLVVGLSLLVPGLPGIFGISVPHPEGWLYLPLFFVLVFGSMVIVASRDLATRSSFVMWDGVGRVCALAAAVVGDMGLGAVAFGLVDALIALIYFTNLPRFVGISFWSLLTGAQSAAPAN